MTNTIEKKSVLIGCTEEEFFAVGNKIISFFKEWGFDSTIEKGRALTFLFYGHPGTGKTLMAQAISDYLDFDLLTITPTDLNDKFFGETEKKIREVFHKADSRTVILFDECDGLIMDRNRGSNITVPHINQFIYDIEHFDGVCIFTTNNIDFLDKAIERRLALKLEFEEPDEKTRLLIWEKIIPEKCPIDRNVDFTYLAKFPINGGHIKNIVLNAARSAARNQSKVIAMQHFLEAIKCENEGIKGFNKIV
jgi:SpoVK/Ycf46/Vps4 family AAA+-type ATPase